MDGGIVEEEREENDNDDDVVDKDNMVTAAE